ncbi:MAG TPA: MerR family transcriptional regulator, partial [Ktedonobacteraceae bacterium]|nr:MerR family transcriptional regulator [Ktedonobacteraceae bacterium]
GKGTSREMEELTIGEVARRAGMRTSALRYYESVGLLPPPRRVAGGHRRYDTSILELLAILRMAQQAGFTLAEMHLLVAGFDASTPASERWQQLAQSKLKEVEAIIAHAQQTKRMLERLLQCGCLYLGECLYEYQREGLSPVPRPSNESEQGTLFSQNTSACDENQSHF